MADLYDTTKQNISLHIKNIFDEEELDINSTVKKFLTVQKEGNRKVERKVKYYNLDMIISWIYACFLDILFGKMLFYCI